MNTEQQTLSDLVHAFAVSWDRLGDPQTSERLLADPILVLGPNGTTPVPRAAFVAAVSARAGAVSAAPASQTSLAGETAFPLGDRMVVATISWNFSLGATDVTLVSDFLLQREQPGALRCVAYLPRTNVLDHLPSGHAQDLGTAQL